MWQIPIGAGLAAMTKVIYDREIAINERHVKHATIMHNSSLILGKQIIHILPEGCVSFLCENLNVMIGADIAQLVHSEPKQRLILYRLSFDPRLSTYTNQSDHTHCY